MPELLLVKSFITIVIFNNFFTSPTGVPITVANDAIEILPPVADKTIKDYQNNQKKQYT